MLIRANASHSQPLVEEKRHGGDVWTAVFHSNEYIQGSGAFKQYKCSSSATDALLLTLKYLIPVEKLNIAKVFYGSVIGTNIPSHANSQT